MAAGFLVVATGLPELKPACVKGTFYEAHVVIRLNDDRPGVRQLYFPAMF